MDTPFRVSVLMSVFNTPIDLVKRAIDSVLKQDFQDFELMVIDDGSDSTIGIELLQYCQLHQSKIVYVFHQNRGQSLSINKGVQLSQGEFIAIIDSDDEYKSNHLSSCLSEMAYADLISSPTDTVIGKEEDYYVPDKYDNQQSIHVDDCILFATLFGKKQVFQEFLFKDIYAADADFYEEASKKYRVKRANFRTYIYNRNIPNSISATLKNKQISLS
jgi:glycosyltransferase involved in cell wall biosynthesis